MNTVKISPELIQFQRGRWVLNHPFASRGGGMLSITADWCGHCKNLKQLLPQVQLRKPFAHFNLDGDAADAAAISKALGVKGFPTIFYVAKGGLLYLYEGPRDIDSLTATFGL